MSGQQQRPARGKTVRAERWQQLRTSEGSESRETELAGKSTTPRRNSSHRVGRERGQTSVEPKMRSRSPLGSLFLPRLSRSVRLLYQPVSTYYSLWLPSSFTQVRCTAHPRAQLSPGALTRSRSPASDL